MFEIENQLDKFLELLLKDEFITSAFMYFLNLVILISSFYLVKKFSTFFIKDDHLKYKFNKIITFIFYFSLGLLTLILLTQHNKHLTLFIGLIAAGIAFALQEVILSIAGFVSIFAANLFKLGDRIKIGEITGDVIDIGLTKTTLMEVGGWISTDNYSGRIIQVPNSKIYKENIFNYSLDFPFVWDEIKLPIKYGSNLKLTEDILLKVSNDILKEHISESKESWNSIISKYVVENARSKPDVAYTLTDNWIEFELRYIVNYKKRRSIKHNLSKDIYKEIQNNQNEIKIASETLEMVNSD